LVDRERGAKLRARVAAILERHGRRWPSPPAPAPAPAPEPTPPAAADGAPADGASAKKKKWWKLW
jgi:hypothetical protein